MQFKGELKEGRRHWEARTRDGRQLKDDIPGGEGEAGEEMVEGKGCKRKQRNREKRRWEAVEVI